MSNIFSRIAPLKPGRSAFDLSYTKLFTADMGILYPVMHDEVVPGDYFKIGNEMVVRMMPLVSPVLHAIKVFVHYFFVPYRILWHDDTPTTGDWETFITGDTDGADSTTIPHWTAPASTAIESLWDYLGYPVGVTPDANMCPVMFPVYAYNMIWNQFYRDETLQTEANLDDEDMLRRNWRKDYFTSSLPWQQRGTSPALPISGTLQALWPAWSAANVFTMEGNSVADAPANAATEDVLENNTIDASGATTFDTNDLRLAVQMQRIMERNARAGVRYTEWLNSHYAVSPRDERLDRPEYIGGSSSNIVISELPQLSETNTTPQGTLAGKGITAEQQYCGKYFVKEYGIIMGLLSIMPEPVYNSEGVNRQWIKTTRWDYYLPELANLSEQAVYCGELVSEGIGADDDIFGYQGRYDEMRYKPNMITGKMRTTFNYWAIARDFAGTCPALNSDFIECDPPKDIFASSSDPGFIVHFGNLIKAIRPLPMIGSPGLVDHH